MRRLLRPYGGGARGPGHGSRCAELPPPARLACAQPRGAEISPRPHPCLLNRRLFAAGSAPQVKIPLALFNTALLKDVSYGKSPSLKIIEVWPCGALPAA